MSSPIPAPASLPAPSRLTPTDGLPHPLSRWDGTPVQDADEWSKRRTELERLFRQYVYGYAPTPSAVEWAVQESTMVLGGRATLDRVRIEFPALPAEAPTIRLAILLPDGAEEVPVVLGTNRNGNHTAIADPAIPVTPTAEQFGTTERGTDASRWEAERLLQRGYGLALFHSADIDPDRDDFTDGIHPYYDDAVPGPPGTKWGTIAAWAWGISRCVDYLLTADRVRKDGIAVAGKSRRGKAALLAAATDDRIDAAVPFMSGTGGCALSRGNRQETITRVTRSFPHWFADFFAAFGSRPDRLPVDQHLLVAMVAPRPVLGVEGSRDYFANPGLALDALRAAEPAYHLLGVPGVTGDGLARTPEAVTDAPGRLCQYRSETDHTITPDCWEAVLNFLDVRL